MGISNRGRSAAFVLLVAAGSLLAGSVATAATPALSGTAPDVPSSRPNVVIFLADDQRFDMVTPRFTPTIYSRLVTGNPYSFANAFAPNPLCCPSRASILTGNYSHTTGVWQNIGAFGGFEAFNDKHTIAVDFRSAGYRTAMIGKYLNGYAPGKNSYVPPGWTNWFALGLGDFYNYKARTRIGVNTYGSEPRDYATRVLTKQARGFVASSIGSAEPFFLYLAYTAPHLPAIPDPRDVGRFADVTVAETNSPMVRTKMLESAFGVDRSVGEVLDVLPDNTIVVYMSDNGYMWGEHGLTGKASPYDESIRIPMILKSLDSSFLPRVGTDDQVLNVDLRATLTKAAGIVPLTQTDGIDWGAPDYVPRDVFPLEYLGNSRSSFCGARELTWAYARFEDGSELLFDTATDPAENNNLDPVDFPIDYARLRQEAQSLCNPSPPGYTWGP